MATLCAVLTNGKFCEFYPKMSLRQGFMCDVTQMSSNRNGGACAPPFVPPIRIPYGLRDSFSPLPARKTGIFLAGTRISEPFLGLWPTNSRR